MEAKKIFLTEEEKRILEAKMEDLLLTIANIAAKRTKNVVAFKMLTNDILMMTICAILNTHVETVNEMLLKIIEKEKW